MVSITKFQMNPIGLLRTSYEEPETGIAKLASGFGKESGAPRCKEEDERERFESNHYQRSAGVGNERC